MHYQAERYLDCIDYDFENISRVFFALSHKERLSIMIMLLSKEYQVSEIADLLKVGCPNVSQHLNILTNAKLVKVRREMNKRIYRISEDNIKQVISEISLILE